MIWDFAGKTALVTGGANGIGEAIVRKLAAASAEVVFSDLMEADGRALEAELSGSGANVRFVVSDATDEAQVAALVAEALSKSGQLDIAINNVGGIARGDDGRGRIHDTNLEAWIATVNLNLTSCFLGMKHQLPPMIAAGQGAIVNFTSLAGMQYSGGATAAYSAAKAGVIQASKYAAIAYAPTGVRINVIAPGFTGTKRMLAGIPDEETLAARSALVPMKRPIDPSETADACLWLCSDAASGVTGSVVAVDGGKAAL